MNAKYLRSQFVPQVSVSWRDTTVTIPDALDYNYQSILAQLIPVFTQSALDGIPLTTIAMKLYGNTSVFWAILAANGYFHPLAIKSGTPVGYPDTTNILSSTSNATTSNSTSSSNNSSSVTI